MNRHILLLFTFILLYTTSLSAQISTGNEEFEINYLAPSKYTIGGITVTGNHYLSSSVIISISGINVGDKIDIPGERLKSAMDKLWKQGLFQDVKLLAARVQGEQVFLDIRIVERPRIAKYSITGVKKSEATDLRDKLKISRGDIITDNLIHRIENTIKRHYQSKGFYNPEIVVIQAPDTSLANFNNIDISINKNKKMRISKINVYGNEKMSEMAIKSGLKKTKEVGAYKFLGFANEAIFSTIDNISESNFKKIPNDVQDIFDKNIKIRIFKPSKFIEKDYEEDQANVIRKYLNNGYLDAKIVKDSVYKISPNRMNIDLYVTEGNKYYFRNITFVGNTKFTSQELSNFIGIKKGDLYDQQQLETMLTFNPHGIDLMSLFADDGYLTCNIEPVILNIENDSIDMQIRIREGKQMKINKVIVSGNTRTNDNVIIRELTIRPGQLFSRSDIISSRTALSQLKYFNNETLGVSPINIDPVNGTVDVAFNVEEASSDQFELSAGWGYGQLIGTIGVSFNNFSTKRLFKKDSWRPIPSGDGQRLSLRVQSYGVGYFSGSVSFVEPWLGGKKPNQLSTSLYNSYYTVTNSETKQKMGYNILGLGVGLSRRLNWPDHYFSFSQNVSLQHYKLSNYKGQIAIIEGDGLYQSYSYSVGLSRYSTDAPLYPRSGSDISFSIEATPPYSLLLPNNFKNKSTNDKYRLIEFHQWKFNSTFYQQIVGDLVIMARTKAGFMGKYNNDIEITPFNRYYMGGDGMSVWGIDGRQIVGFRGYSNSSLTTDDKEGSTIFNKSTLELRYPLTLNPNSTIFALMFLEAGNTWDRFRDFNPFNVRRSAGVGVRVFLPMFGLLGLDWGYGFDDIPGNPGANKGQFHFSINGSID